MKIGQRIRHLREKARMTQRDLARKADFDFAVVSRIEAGKGNPTLSTLERFASALDVPLAWLFVADLEEDGRAA